MAESLELYNLIVYNDMLETELLDVPLEHLLDNDLKCKLKNAMKATKSLTDKFAEMFNEQNQDIDYFGELADNIKEHIDNHLKKEFNE